MITRFLPRACVLVLVLSVTSVAQEASAEVMCWMICQNCDPTINESAVNEILTQDQQGGCSNAGSRNGWEHGDTVVIQKADGSSIGRWEYQGGVDRWDPISIPQEGVQCETGWFDFDACIDMTPGTELYPTPPWTLPEMDPPTAANVFCELHNNCGWTYTVTFGSDYTFHYLDVDYRHNNNSWLDYVNADEGTCNVDYAGGPTTVDVRVTVQSIYGTAQGTCTLNTYWQSECI